MESEIDATSALSYFCKKRRLDGLSQLIIF